MSIINETFIIQGKDAAELDFNYKQLVKNMYASYPRQGYDTYVNIYQTVARRDGMLCAAVKTSRRSSCD